MPHFQVAYLVQNGRDLDPQLEVGGTKLGPLTIGTDFAQSELVRELGRITPESLMVHGYIPTVLLDIEADDESDALAKGFRQATISLEPYSLLAPEAVGFDFSRRRPTILPQALLIDHEASPPQASIRYHDGPSLLRITIGDDAVARAHKFNNVIRRIAQLYPVSLMQAGARRTDFEIRIARAVHWYSQGEGQMDSSMALVCYWIGLESIVLKSSNSTSKKQKMLQRLSAVGMSHEAEVDWASVVSDLWEMRSDIVHEAGGSAYDGGLFPEVRATDINNVKHFFFLALLYALEQRAAGVAFEELWSPYFLDNYSPGVVIRVAEVPYLFDALNLQRRTVTIS